MGLAKGTTGVAVLLVAAGAYYWLHERASRPQPERYLPRRRWVPRSPSQRSNSSPAPGSPLRTGEILDYTADVAKVSNVANLRLQVAERRNFLGKTAWHLQAFAHTENPLRMVFELDDQFDSYRCTSASGGRRWIRCSA